MFVNFLVLAILYAGYAGLGLYRDTHIRATNYTEPLSKMPENADELARQMLGAALAGGPVDDARAAALRLEIWSILSEGAVAQRNHQMLRVRKEISLAGRFLSWFMKQKGLSYDQIAAKYDKMFSQDDQRRHWAIIKSAATANPDVFEKLRKKLTSMFFASSSSSSPASVLPKPPPGGGPGGGSLLQAKL